MDQIFRLEMSIWNWIKRYGLSSYKIDQNFRLGMDRMWGVAEGGGGA